jgi:type VI secretion system secreted protein VgrG
MANGTSLQVVVTDTSGNTAFPADALTLVDFRGSEGLSQLYTYELFLSVKSGKSISFDQILGQQVTVTLGLENNTKRYFSGICNTIAEGLFLGARFRVTVVPNFWLLTRKVRSRVFDHKSVPDILEKTVLKGVPGLEVRLQLLDRSKYPVHEFCTQYRESDFNFACRLMEEEGIHYFFDSTDKGTVMILADASAGAHKDIGTSVLFGSGWASSFTTVANRVLEWERAQQLRSSSYTLLDHNFEHQTPVFESTQQMPAPVINGGSVSYNLKTLGADFAIADYPGEYAHRFDDVAVGGGANTKGVDQIQADKARTARIRIEQEAVSGLLIRGTSSCGAFAAGKTFQVTDNADANGKYLLVSVAHGLTQAASISGADGGVAYQNSFTAIPFDIKLPFRPPRLASRPFIAGSQTAVVVGYDAKKAPEDEILTDKFGRVKVKFHWDQVNDPDVDCSCWVRVAQVWAGKQWGASFWPRIGQEVVVSFLEGNPDQPLIVGSVYNALQMPPYIGGGLDSKHKDDNKVSGIKTNTTPGGVGFNELRFDDTKGNQQVFIHAERNMDVRVKGDSMESVGGTHHVSVGSQDDETMTRGGEKREVVFGPSRSFVKRSKIEFVQGALLQVYGFGDAASYGPDPLSAEECGEVLTILENDKNEDIGGSSYMRVRKNQEATLDGSRFEAIGGDCNLLVRGYLYEEVDQTHSLNVKQDQQVQVGQDYALQAGGNVYLNGGTNVVIEAGSQLTLKVGGNFVNISAAGVAISGTMVMINSGGAAGSGTPPTITAPAVADPLDLISQVPGFQAGRDAFLPVAADDSQSGASSAPKASATQNGKNGQS